MCWRRRAHRAQQQPTQPCPLLRALPSPAAALATCLACGWSYRSWRRSQRRHAKLARQLAASQASNANSKDGLIAAAALDAMAKASEKTEWQLISTFVVGFSLWTLLGSRLGCCWGLSGDGVDKVGALRAAPVPQQQLEPGWLSRSTNGDLPLQAMKTRRVHDSVGSCVCCWARPAPEPHGLSSDDDTHDTPRAFDAPSATNSGR